MFEVICVGHRCLEEALGHWMCDSHESPHPGVLLVSSTLEDGRQLLPVQQEVGTDREGSHFCFFFQSNDGLGETHRF